MNLSLSLYAQQSGLLGANPLLGASQSQALQTQNPSALDLQVQRDQVQISAYGLLLAALSGFRTSMQSLELPGFITQTVGTSSNPAVASVAVSGAGSPSASNPLISGAQPGTFGLNVTQLATAQSVESAGFADPNNTSIGTGTLTISAGTYNSGLNTFTQGSASPVTVTITNPSLNAIASAINASGAPAVASVVQDGAGYHLLLTASGTGTANTLKVTASDNDGTNVDSATGLSQLAYDPTAAVGSGKNLTQLQAAQNAAFTVNGASSSSQSNFGVVMASGVTANLLTTGSTTLTVTPDFNGTQSSAQAIVNAFNTVQGALNNLTGNLSGPLSGDFLASRVISGLNRIAAQTFSNGSSKLTSLSQLGLNYQVPGVSDPGALFGNGGTLALSTSTLQNAFNSDANGVISLLSAAVQAFDVYAKSYAGAGGTVPSTLNALQRNSHVDQYLAQQYAVSSQSKLPSLSDLLVANSRGTPLTGPLTAGQIQAAQQYARSTMLFSPPGGLSYSLVQALFGSSASGGGSFSAFA